MTTDNKQQTNEPQGFKLNRHSRRRMERQNKRKGMTRLVKTTSDKYQYTDDSYKDKTKRVFSRGMNYVWLLPRQLSISLSELRLFVEI